MKRTIGLALLAAVCCTQLPARAEAGAANADSALGVGGLVQIDWRVHGQASLDELDPASGAPLNDDRILLRRGRLFASVAQGFASARLELEASTVDALRVRPYEAWVAARWPENVPDSAFQAGTPGARACDAECEGATATRPALRASLGLLPIAFGVDPSEPMALRPLLERSSWSTALFGSGRDFGLSLSGIYRFLRVSAALMNGEPLDTGRYSGLDLTRSKDFLGRAAVGGRLLRAVSVEAGFSWLAGEGLHPGFAGTKDTLAWSDSNENGLVDVSELSVIAGTPASPSRTFSRAALAGDLRVAVATPLGVSSLCAEVVRARNLDRAVVPADPVATGRDLREFGWSLRVSQTLLRHLEVAVRYDSYDPDSDARRAQGGLVVPSDSRFSTWGFALSTRVRGLRLMTEYDHNDNALGRGANGAPTRLRNDRLNFRAEFAF
ncbi:MAG: hypothetical protein QM756_42820 [Polyangiaceae bacterium]